MTNIDCDIAIIGSGFGGTLLALIARQLGRSVALLERGVHPRFAIGESSTPLADFKLAKIADRFGLDWLKPFAKYGSWKQAYPEVRCGLKRGFSFFRHQPGQMFAPTEVNDNSLLVAASPDHDRADTHWFRADFDAHLVEQAVDSGVTYLDRLNLDAIHRETPWRLHGTRLGENVLVRADFVIDGTGDAQLLSQSLGLEQVPASTLSTRSRALYSHFTGVSRWHDLLEEHGTGTTAEHPFPCDAAALHQIIDGGWMWILRFDDGITSAGFSLDPEIHPIRSGESPAMEWQRLLNTYPSLVKQFAGAKPIQPMVRTGRLQRRLTLAAGDDWALLPHAAGFLDPWLSPGIAQSLFAVERLADVLAKEWSSPHRARRLASYGASILSEMAWLDEITATCFACLDRFEVMVSVTMLYFIAAIYCEERARAGEAPADAAFLLADDEIFRNIAGDLCREALTVTSADANQYADKVRALLATYNTCNLADPLRRNLYPYLGSPGG